MTSVEISKQITDSILETIGERIDHMRNQRSNLASTEWALILNGVVRTLDQTINYFVTNKLINTKDYETLYNVMDVLAELKYTYRGGE